ncbi:MAG: LytR/AlgR family response regulator transcription factor [Bacteroidaceae bacterium]
MNKITCAIVDDEPLARALLESYVRKTPFLVLKGQHDSASSALHDLISDPVDVVFLDIQMPDLDGLQFSHMLPSSTRVVFTTAFSEYAVEGFRVNALDYLKKPINYNEFLESVNKALAWFNPSTSSPNIHVRQDLNSMGGFIYVKSDYKLVQISLDKLLYVEGVKDYLKIYVEDGEPVMTLMSLKMLEEKLPYPRFMRIHRSYLVQVNKVASINKSVLTIGQEQLPIGEAYKDELQRYVTTHIV